MAKCYKCSGKILNEEWLTDDEGEIHVYCFLKSGKSAKKIKLVNVISFFQTFRFKQESYRG